MDDILSRLGANCFRKGQGTGRSAKDEIRRVLGTYSDDGTLPDYTIGELSTLTKKSEVNVRTMLSDLRSVKYAGREGVFLTERVKRPGGEIAFRFLPPSEYRNVELVAAKPPSPQNKKETLQELVPGLTPELIEAAATNPVPAGKRKKPEFKADKGTNVPNRAHPKPANRNRKQLDDSVLDGLHNEGK